MLACLSQLGTTLVTWAQEHRDASLATHEQGVLDAVRAALPTLLATVVQTSTRALDPAQAAWRAPTADAQALLQRERGYFQRNRARMDYPAFRARGLPIGSGAVESAAKHLVQLRLKRPGARWSEAGAQAILTLRAHPLSGRLRAA
jgi:hypothetical protein